jgi:hypothetical protein
VRQGFVLQLVLPEDRLYVLDALLDDEAAEAVAEDPAV